MDGDEVAAAYGRAALPRLRFVDPGVEARYVRWRTEQAAPLVRAGMLLALVGGVVILLAGIAADAEYVDAFAKTVAIVSPGLSIAAVLSSVQPRSSWLLPVAAAAAAWWGSVLVWRLHHAIDAPELGTTAVLLVGLWGLIVFRLPPGLGICTCLTFTTIHQVGLASSDLDVVGTAVFHAAVTWMVLAAAVVLSIVVDRGARTEFAQQAIIAEQRDLIERERRRADDLLRNVLPEAIAQRLKDGARTIADHHDAVTVLFADVVGFTALSSRLGAADLVTLLDEVFRRLDDVIDRHGAEKIKTIGDAYMVVAGAPEPRADHVEVIAEVALDIVAEIDAVGRELGHALEVRVGVALGHAVAGVIGRRRFAYDLWSDTVNMAARMESHGIPGCIQVTEATARRLEPRYLVRERGVIDVKGKGPTRTWLLDGRRPPADAS